MSTISDRMWEFKYAPKDINSMILPERESAVFNKWIESGDVSNCLFVSANPGCGKTSLTNIFRESSKFVTIFINASRETSVDVVRNTVSSFVKTVAISAENCQKLVILDEADRLSPNALDALKAEIEMCASNARFIFTANRETAFPNPILSRLCVFNFDKMFVDNKQELMISAFKRMSRILESENIEFDKNALVSLVKKKAPDWRSLLKACQLLSAYDGKIDMSSVERADFACDIDELIKHISEKNFTAARTFSAKNAGNEVSVMTELWRLVDSDRVVDTSKPALVMLLADMNRYVSVVPDPEIEMFNAIVQIMTEVEFAK